jgi:hypothetical protein
MARENMTPPAHPPKAGVLYLLRLPPDADRATYEAAWNKAVSGAGPHGEDWEKNLWEDYISKLQGDHGVSYDKAHEMARQLPEGKRLKAAFNAACEAKKQNRR